MVNVTQQKVSISVFGTITSNLCQRKSATWMSAILVSSSYAQLHCFCYSTTAI